MTTLIFDTSISGHHLEYLHHYYMGALSRKEEKYIMMVPKEFHTAKDKYIWPEDDHIIVEYIKPEDETLLKEKNFYKLGWNASKILNKVVRSKNVDKIILTMLMQFIPFIIFLLPRKVSVRGIMYKIYLYEERNMPCLRLLAERIRFWLAAHSDIIDKVFVLNDKGSAQKLNRIYKTDKFRFLPDPVPEIDMDKVHDVRTELNIPIKDVVYLHFGSLDGRKGTLDILNAIISSTRQAMKDKTFIFAGKQKENMRKQFYPLLEKAKAKANILVFDEFCSYEFLNNLCFSCDVILMPYYLTNLSSGLLGYAAVFCKPVIGPENGLIGKLIKEYHLGNTIEVPIKETDLFVENFDNKFGFQQYSRKNSLYVFTTLIME